MKTRISATLIASLLVAGTVAQADDSPFTWSGTVGIGGQIVDTSGTDDEGRCASTAT